jgi:hypothetical protein
MKLIMMDTMMTVTMQNRSLIIVKMELIIDRLPLQSTRKAIPNKIAILRTNLLRSHTNNMKLRQRPHTNQIDTLSQGVILETQTEDLMEDMDQVLFSSQKVTLTSLLRADTNSILKGTSAATPNHLIEEEEELEVGAEGATKKPTVGDNNNSTITLTIINNSILTTTTITTTELFSQLKTSKSDSLFIISCLHPC